MAVMGGVGGCLSDTASPIAGRQILVGRDLSEPSFAPDSAVPVVLFHRPLPAEGNPLAAIDFQAVDFAGGPERRLVHGASGDGAYSWDSPQRLYIVRDEREVPSATSSGQQERIGTLVRVPVGGGDEEEVADAVSSYRVTPQGRLLYYGYEDQATAPALHLKEIDGDDRVLMAQARFATISNGKVYLRGGEDKAFARVAAPGAALEILARDTESFSLRGDDRWAILRTTLATGGRLLLHDLVTGSDVELQGQGIFAFLGFLTGSRFLYVESQPPAGGGNLHVYHLPTLGTRGEITAPGFDMAYPIPPAGGDVRQVLRRPGTDELLLSDTVGRMWLFRAEANPPVQAFRSEGVGPGFTASGRFLLYFELVDSGGSDLQRRRLWTVDLDDLDAPPRLVSPESVTVGGYTTIGPDGIMFWGRIGDPGEGSDVYLDDLGTGAQRVLAAHVGGFVVDGMTLVGTVDVSNQDLIGTLVRLDLATSARTVLDTGVVAFDVQPACAGCGVLASGARLVWQVSNRHPTARDGLWAGTLP